MGTILNTDLIGVHRPSLNKDFKTAITDVVAYLNASSLLDRSTLVDNADGTYTYTTHDGATTFNIDTNAGAISIVDAAGNFTATNVEDALAELFTTVASITVVSADANNSISVGTDGGAFFDHNVSTVTGVQATGKIIATHDDGYGTTTNVRETVTGISYNPATKIISYTDENGTATNLDLSALAVDVFVDGATINAGVLTLTDNAAGTPDVVVDLNSLTGVLTNNVDGSFDYADLSGTQTVQMLSLDAGNSAFAGVDGGVYFQIGALDPLP